MKRIERRIDVTEAATLGETIEMAVTIFLPDPADLPEHKVAIFACPGGGYSRAYFYMNFAGHENYNEADYHVARGTIYVAIDHIGVGESTIPDLSKIGFDTFAATHDRCVRQIVELLASGGLDPDFPTCPDLFKVGMGQSMGGGVSILTQARFATFDAIAPCGKSAIHTALPQRTAEAFERDKSRFDVVSVGDSSRNHTNINHEGVDFLYAFHWEDVPADILAADMEGGYPLRHSAPEFGSLTIPYCATQMMTPGCFKDDAPKISVPVLVGVGERDTCPNPRAEPSAYTGSPDISVYIVPGMAHMHNFATTRELLWARLHGWSRLLAEEKARRD